MTFDLQRIIESKRAYRVRLAALPIGEKLRMLDTLCERQRIIRSSASKSESTLLREEAAAYSAANAERVEWDAGSRMHVLDWLESTDFIAKVQKFVAPTGFVVKQNALRQPKGRADHRESVLTGSEDTFLTPVLKSELRKWWLAYARGSKLPTWDLVVGAKDASNRPGLILVEAKAHATELSSEGKILSKRDTAEAQARTDANHKQIAQAIQEACDLLQASIPGLTLSCDQSYQFCNRIAFAWKLAVMGLPVVLIYLGFLNDRGINEQTYFASHADWERTFLSHTKDHYPATHLHREIATTGTPFWLVVRSLAVARVSPPRDQRRQLR